MRSGLPCPEPGPLSDRPSTKASPSPKTRARRRVLLSAALRARVVRTKRCSSLVPAALRLAAAHKASCTPWEWASGPARRPRSLGLAFATIEELLARGLCTGSECPLRKLPHSYTCAISRSRCGLPAPSSSPAPSRSVIKGSVVLLARIRVAFICSGKYSKCRHPECTLVCGAVFSFLFAVMSV